MVLGSYDLMVLINSIVPLIFIEKRINIQYVWVGVNVT